MFTVCRSFLFLVVKKKNGKSLFKKGEATRHVLQANETDTTLKFVRMDEN